MKLRSWSKGALTLTAGAALCATFALPAQAAVGRGVPGVTSGGAPGVIGRGAPEPAGRAGAAEMTRIALTTKAPYEPEGNLHAYPQPPRGFQPVFTESVQRHGERDLSSSGDGDSFLALWQLAQTDNALTPLGKSLGPEVTKILAANTAIGFGNLDTDGKQELEAIAGRMAQRLPSLFAAAAKDAAAGSTTPEISVTAASQQRTVDSATAYVAGLEKAVPGLAPVVGATTTDNDLLYFHKAAVNQDYQDYVASDPNLLAAESTAEDSPISHTEAAAMLERSFTPAFVKQLAAGDFSAEFANEVDAATALYSLWAVTKDMADEGTWSMDRYLTSGQEAWFGYLDDVTSFYENGPAFAGSDITYKMAGVLLDNVFDEIQAKVNGTSRLVAALNFTHAEEVFPLATLLGLPGSSKQEPVGTEYTYADNTFRGANVAPMAANIQWDVFKSGATYLVRMLYNERPTAFKASCTPVSRDSYFYNLKELESCYGYTPAGS